MSLQSHKKNDEWIIAGKRTDTRHLRVATRDSDQYWGCQEYDVITTISAGGHLSNR